ncbi:hypothetical protein L596_004962 [Steinernema carpocapsae]|uniref:SAC3/GANP/THP3 conserved domain-containing protein n=1 Tax=Steinernema carpocapsae TaxID=34508 RepID=A0A4U8UXH2_STECR|nr:hypothetical protein L596_004962 [Steinernema carpocapsae]
MTTDNPSITARRNVFQGMIPNRNVRNTLKGRRRRSSDTAITSITPTDQFVRELNALLGSYCPNEEKRYEIFKERDVILQRLRKQEIGDETKMVMVEGTCPDFCCEKERYRRIFQNAVNIYETNASGVPVAELFVTDYSRSAADQEQPLPHELRTCSALQDSMNYVLSTIPNREVSSSEATRWYDFAWSRTRAIRKEITQQKIISPAAVDILEKCCRIHIYASHQFCDAGTSEFDERMNMENMTKCIQSLRHMYEDLAKKGIFLESEAEFRSYDVLSNIADSNILQQVFKLRLDVRESLEMKLAVKLFLAFNTNNYVRFFRLIAQNCTYLQACLLHQVYFQVRADALKTISASYKNEFLLADLTEQLAFDDEEHAKEFIAKFEIHPKPGDPTNIALPRNLEEVARTVQVSKLINRMNNKSLLEVLSGTTSSTQIKPKPVTNSFNAEGRYVNDPVVFEALKKLGSTSMPMIKRSETEANKLFVKAEVDERRPSSALGYRNKDSVFATKPKTGDDFRPSSAIGLKPPLFALAQKAETAAAVNPFGSANSIFQKALPKESSEVKGKLQTPSKFSFKSGPNFAVAAPKPASSSASSNLWQTDCNGSSAAPSSKSSFAFSSAAFPKQNGVPSFGFSSNQIAEPKPLFGQEKPSPAGFSFSKPAPGTVRLAPPLEPAQNGDASAVLEQRRLEKEHLQKQKQKELEEQAAKSARAREEEARRQAVLIKKRAEEERLQRTLWEQQSLKIQQQTELKMQWMNEVTGEMFATFMDSMLNQAVLNIGSHVLRETFDQRKRDIFRTTLPVLHKSVLRVINDKIGSICEEMFETLVVDVRKKLNEIGERLHVLRMKERVQRYGFHWKSCMEAAIAKRKRQARLSVYFENMHNGVQIAQPEELRHVGRFYDDPWNANRKFDKIMEEKRKQREALQQPIVRQTLLHWHTWARTRVEKRRKFADLRALPEFKFGTERNCMKPFKPTSCASSSNGSTPPVLRSRRSISSNGLPRKPIVLKREEDDVPTRFGLLSNRKAQSDTGRIRS